MPDDLRALLVRAADDRIAAETVPDIRSVRSGATAIPRRPRHRGWVAPALAVAAVIGVAAGVSQLPALHTRIAPVAIPPAPKLERVVPPLVVAKRLGAPAGHLNGPPVSSADTLAISPLRKDGLGLRTVAVITPHKPDAAGHTRINWCLYTYSEPDPVALHGRCTWSVAPGLPGLENALTVEIHGGPGQTWVSGNAPARTAAVLLHSNGRKDVIVPVADPGAAWDHQPFFVVWRARVGTDVTALDRAGHVLARTRLPSEVISRHTPADPELGTVETPQGLWEQYGQRCRFPAGARPPSPGTSRSSSSDPGQCPPGMVRDSTPRPARVDVLARYRISDTVTLLRYGLLSGSVRCVVDTVRDYGPDAVPGGGGGGCGEGLGTAGPPIDVQRSFSAGTGAPQEQLLSGSAVPGTVRVRLSAAGHRSVEVRAYDAGPRWKHRAYFVAPWPSAAATRVVALGRDGQQLAARVDRGLNPHAFDANFLAAEASCMQHHGIQVITTPQPGNAPMYEFRPGTLSPAQMTSVQNGCEDEASRLTS